MNMLRIWLGVALLFMALVPAARASFAEPKSCRNLSASEMLAMAEVAGLGVVTKADCECQPPFAWVYHCRGTVQLTEVSKGSAGSLNFDLAYPTDAPYLEQCLQYQAQARQLVGTRKMFYFAKRNNDYVEVETRQCVY